MKRLIKGLVLVVLVTAAIFAGRYFYMDRHHPSASEFKLYGNIDIRKVDLAFNEQERIVEVLVEEGDRVSAGQVLAKLQTNRLDAQINEMKARIAAQQEVVNRLETGTRQQEIDQARAEVAAALARVRNSKKNYKRAQETSQAGATSQQVLDNTQALLDIDQAQLKVKEKALNLALEGPRKEDIAAARNQLETLWASLSFLKIRLSDTTLTSPVAGVIQNRILEPGEMAGPTRPVVTLALTDPKWVRAYVPEPYLGHIRLGMKTKIKSDSFPKKTFEGWIGFISPVAEFTPKAVATEDLRTKLVYETRVFVSDSKDQLRLGMPTTVIIDQSVSLDEGRKDGVSSPKTLQPDKE